MISIVDRYLEHARAFYFHNGGRSEYWLASADWMPRNLDHRVEIAFPILDPRLQSQIREVLEIQLSDTVKAREIQPDGSSRRRARVLRGAPGPLPVPALRPDGPGVPPLVADQPRVAQAGQALDVARRAGRGPGADPS